MKNNDQRDNKWVFFASLFEREGACLEESELSVAINGIYSIPDEYQKLEASGAVDNWFYQIKVPDINFTEGKSNVRELTEAEKKEIEAKKNAKAANKSKKEEINQQELDRLEKERIEKEEKEKKLLDEWNAIDEQTRFYKKKENPTEEVWISFPQGKNMLSISKNGEKIN